MAIQPKSAPSLLHSPWLTLFASVSPPSQVKIIPTSWGNRVGEAEFQEEKREVNPNISTKKEKKTSQHQAGAMEPWGKNILITKKYKNAILLPNYFAVPRVQHQLSSNPCSLGIFF